MAFSWRNSYIILVIICSTAFFGSESLGTTQFTGLRRTGVRLAVNYTEYEIYSSSVIRCAALCQSTAGWRTFSWNKQQKLCLLGSADVTHDRAMHGPSLDKDVAWDTMSLMEYTVFIAWNSSWSLMSFEMAKELCIMRHTVIASPADLAYSHSIGFHFLKCTWLSDGTIGYSIQTDQEIYTECVINSKPHAMCRLN